MGWNAACIFVNENGPGYFGGLPPHRSERATGLLSQIYLRAKLRPVCGSNLLDELEPPKAHFGFGAYDHGCVLSDWYEVIGCTVDSNKPILQRCLSLFSGASVLAFELSSGVNAFGYALYEGGVLRRAHAGNAKDGITTHIGQPLLEEEGFFRDSEVRAGERFFRQRVGGELMEFSTPVFGETLVFHVASRFLGTPFDRFPAESLAMERFRR